MSVEQLKGQDDMSKLDAIRYMARKDSMNAIRQIESGWASGLLPTTEPFVKEYLRAVVMSNKLDGVNLTGLASILAKSENGSVTMADPQSQQLLAAALLQQQRSSFNSAGEHANRPLHVAITPTAKNYAATALKALLTLGGMFFVGSIFMSMFSADAKSIASKVGLAPSSNIKQAEHSDKTFDDVVGIDEAKTELEEIVMYLKEPKKFTRLGGKLPRGILLTGPPGTGKTLLAKAIAGEAGVPFFYSSGSEFEEMYVGVGARRVRDLFAAANANAPCIIFIDEIDAVGGTRHLKDQTAMKMTLNQLLVEMDGFQENNGVIVIGATNFADALDSALVRPGRFDRHIDVPLPDVGGRKAILELYAKKMPLSADVDLEQIARGTPGFSGAELFNLMNQAAVKSSVNNEMAITMKALEWAKDRITMGAERQSAILTTETMKLTATHEAGHALVGLLTEGADPIHKATIIPRGRALGLVLQLPDGDQTSMTYKQMLARLDVCMGGRVAEQVVFGTDNVTSGASSDFQQATRLARMMVTKFGLSEKIGAIYIDNDTHARDGTAHAISGEMQELVDKEIKRLLDESYHRVVNLLTHNRQKLQNIASALMQYETLSGSEIVDVINTNVGPNGAITLKNRSEKPSREMKVIPLNKDRKGGSGGAAITQPGISTNAAAVKPPQPQVNKQQAIVKSAPSTAPVATPPSTTTQHAQKPLASNNNSYSESNSTHSVATSNGVSSTLTPPPSSSSSIGSFADYFFGKSVPAAEPTQVQASPQQQSTAVPVAKNANQKPAAISSSSAGLATPSVEDKVPIMNANRNPSHSSNNATTAIPNRRARGPPVIVQETQNEQSTENSQPANDSDKNSR